MTFPVIETEATTVRHNGTFNWGAQNMPAGIVAGDLLVAIVSCDGPARNMTFSGSTWTEIYEESPDLKTTISIAYREATGGDTLNLACNQFEAGCCLVLRISGAEDPATQAPEVSAGAQSPSSTTFSPLSLTPSGGAADFLWLAIASTENPTVGFTSGPASYTSSSVGGNNAAATRLSSGRRSLNAASEDPGDFTFPSASNHIGVTMAVHPAGAGGTPALGLASETGSALGLSAAKSKAPGVSSETSTALPITASKAKVAGIAAATDAALPLGAEKSKAVGLATAAGAALPLGTEKSRAVGVAAEMDTALPLSGVTPTLGLAQESDAALPVTADKSKAIGIASEAASALSVVGDKRKSVGVASDGAVSLPVRSTKEKAVGIAAEVDSALPLSMQTPPLGLVSVADVALPIAAAKTKAVGIATFVHTVHLVSATKERVVGLPVEIDTAIILDANIPLVASTKRTLAVSARSRTLTAD